MLTSPLAQFKPGTPFRDLPYQKTEAREITRQARMAHGYFVTVTFKAMVPGIDMLYEADCTLFHRMTHQAVLTKDQLFRSRARASF